MDAIRWALGEQSPKSLRTGKTEDVIFAGNERRKPLGMAEVMLTFDNADGALKIDASEVQITRRAYRAGESEFFINRQNVRLRDIIELFMGTGLGPDSYAIVSQGQIDAILSSKPTERRSLFEETAGIAQVPGAQGRIAAPPRADRAERNPPQRPFDRNRCAHPRARDASAPRARATAGPRRALRDLEILSYLRAGASRRSERERLQSELERLEVERAGAAARAATVEAELAALRTQLYQRERALETLARRNDAGAQRAGRT